LKANEDPGSTIAFALPSTPATILLDHDLPPITAPTIIDARTQPGYLDRPVVCLKPYSFPGIALVLNRGLHFENAPSSRVFGLAIAGYAEGGSSVVRAFEGYGIAFVRSHGSQVAGCWIGFDLTETAAPNQGYGVYLMQSGNCMIGGGSKSDRNVIAANRRAQVMIRECGRNVVSGNYLGTDSSGSHSVGGTASGPGFSFPFGSGNGVWIASGDENVIGGRVPAERNVISANRAYGVQIESGQRNHILGNAIGVAADGISNLGNGLHGVVLYSSGLDCSDNRIEGNAIAWNELAGVVIHGLAGRDTSRNVISQNSIFGNTLAGIDLVARSSAALDHDGVTRNDSWDRDSGPNDLQNFPRLTAATMRGATIEVLGKLNSSANTSYRIECFWNEACDPSRHGEGRAFIGFTYVMTNDDGRGTFRVSGPRHWSRGFVTATATDDQGNTSEFSGCEPLRLSR
jgi:hypothetical protein